MATTRTDTTHGLTIQWLEW